MGESSEKKHYFCSMFLRKRKNSTGTISVVIVDKNNGKYKEIKTIGISSDPSEIDNL